MAFLSARLISVRIFRYTGYQSDNFIVGLTDVSPAITAPTVWNYDVCAQYPGSVGDGATAYLRCTSCMPPRRYLIVQVERIEVLSFCEIEVYVIRGTCRLIAKFRYAIWSQTGPKLVADQQRAGVWPTI